MKRETRERIEYYKTALPNMKARVFGAVLLLVFAAGISVVASFAWLTVSRSPDVTGTQLSIITNGSLEIGLSKPDGSAPDEFDVDEALTISTDVLFTNLQWGNIINLADSRYGIENIALRPAQLNVESLLERPLLAADYGSDGRVSTQGDNYTYFSYDLSEERLKTSTLRGVRAIAHFTTQQTELSSTAREYAALRTALTSKQGEVNNIYKNKVMSNANLKGLEGLMSAYAQGELNRRGYGPSSDSNVDISDYLDELSSIYGLLCSAMDKEAEVMVDLANLQQYVYAKKNSTEESTVTYTELTWNDIVANKEMFDPTGTAHKTTASNPKENVSLTGLKQFISDYDWAKKDSSKLSEYYENYRTNGTKYSWNDIDGGGDKNIVTRLCNPKTVELEGKPITSYGTEELIGYVSLFSTTPSKYYPVTLKDGILARFEQTAIDEASRLNGNQIAIVVKAKVSIISANGSIGGKAYTSAQGASYSKKDSSALPSELQTTLKTADDTFGLVVDLYVRTNDDNSYLMLDGHVKSSSKSVRAMGVDGDGGTVELYTISDMSGGSAGGAAGLDVYKKGSLYYYAGSNTQVESAVMGSQVPVSKYENDITVTGFEGSNRIWEENPLLTADSTTQGSGSCYIYYADTPEDFSRSLDLLEGMHVAFVSATDNELYAIASMDTDHAYALNGRVTVPIIIDGTKVENAGHKITVTSRSGDESTGYYITKLNQDVPKQLTTIVYLDGNVIENTNVLSSGNIDGQLNIQFCSSNNLNTMGDDRLEAAEHSVSASVTKTEINYDTADTIADLTTDVIVTVNGENPSTVSAFFSRAINSTQGKRLANMNFTRQSDGSWKASQAFTSPGTYYLRYIRLDGVDYPLEEPCKVVVSGFEIGSLSWGEAGNHAVIYTTSGTYEESVQLSFLSQNSTKQPSSVSAKFIRSDGNSVNINLSNNNGIWKGTGSFSASGNYSLDYIVINGDYHALKRVDDAGNVLNDFSKTLELHMGITTQTWNNGSTLMDEYDPDAVALNIASNPDGKCTLYNKSVKVLIYDNSGNELQNLKDTILHYSKNGSGSGTIDTNLTWDTDSMAYVGTLPIVNIGRYDFRSVSIGSSFVTASKGAPSFSIMPPNPPAYKSTESGSEYLSSVQSVLPLSLSDKGLNAVMGPIVISDSEAAIIDAVVSNTVTGEDYNIEFNEGETSSRGKIFLVGGKWYITLPAYEDEDEEGLMRQQGKWHLKELRISGVYDENAVLYTREEPMVWTHGQGYNFSKLDTTVTDTIKVEIVPGETSVGSPETPFFEEQQLVDDAAYVRVTDENGTPIKAVSGLPGSLQVTDIKYELNYHGNNDSSTYGYKVDTGAQSLYSVKFGTYDDADGSWKLSQNANTRYVGEYTVKGLTVTMEKDGIAFTISSADNPEYIEGIPENYKVYAGSPSASENLLVGSLSAYATEFGKTGDNITGEFLQSYSIKPSIDIKVVKWNGSTHTGTDYVEVEHVILDELTARMDLYHEAGTNEYYGNYTYSGSVPASEHISANLSKGSGSSYSATLSFDLAGVYEACMTLGISGNETTYSSSDSAASLNANGMSNLKGLKVWSMQPTVEVKGVDTTEVTFNRNTGDDNYLTSAASTDQAKNTIGDSNDDGNNDYAIVYMEYSSVGQKGKCDGDCGPQKEFTENSYLFSDYTQPKVSFELKNAGTKPARLEITDNTSCDFAGNGTKQIEIGQITRGENKVYYHEYTSGFLIWTSTEKCYIGYPTETQSLIGTQKVSTLSSNIGEVKYTRTLSEPVTIIQEANKGEYTISWQEPDGLNISVKCNGTPISNGQSVGRMSRITMTLTAASTDYYDPRLVQPAGIDNWEAVEGEESSSYSFIVGSDNLDLATSVSAYPRLSWTSDDAVLISADAGGTAVTSGRCLKEGMNVNITLTRDKEEYYAPRMSSPIGVSDWHVISETTEGAKYSFTMPDSDVTLLSVSKSNTPTLSWTSDKVNVSISGITSGSYVLPGTKITAILDAGSNGYAPRLSGVDGATCPTPEADRETATTLTWTFYMPESNVDMKGVCTKDTLLTLVGKVDPSQIDLSIVADGFQKENGDGVKKDQPVVITIEAKDGYYNPSIARPDIIPAGSWHESLGEGTYYTSAQYSFKMPGDDVNLTVQLSECPTVSCDGTNETITLKKGTVNVASGSRVFPGTALTATATADANYYNPTITSNAALSGSNPGTYFPSTSRTFTVETSNVVLSGSATIMPKITFSWVNTVKSLTGENDNDNAQVNSGGYVLPGRKLIITAVPEKDYFFKKTNYDPIYEKSGNGTLTKNNIEYGSAEYTYIMGTTDTELSCKAASDNPTITINNTGTTATVKASGTTISNNTKVRPGTSITVSYSASSGYKNASCTIKKGEETIKENPFTMPESSVQIILSADKDSGTCFSGDTLITLADGSRKMARDLRESDRVLTFNHWTGEYESKELLVMVTMEDKYCDVCDVIFDNESHLTIFNAHGLFDLSRNEYVIINSNNVSDYVGDSFAAYDPAKNENYAVKMIDYKLSEQTVTTYSFLSKEDINLIANNLLTISDAIEGLYNLFEYDKDLTYSEESIKERTERFGISPYSEWEKYFTYDQYIDFNLPYANIAEGLGLTTKEQHLKTFLKYYKFVVSADFSKLASALKSEMPPVKYIDVFANLFEEQ